MIVKEKDYGSRSKSCAVCPWKPPFFLTKAYARTFLTIHHILSVADGGRDEAENLIILCPNGHSLADYLPSHIVLPLGEQRRSALVCHLKLLNGDPDEWKRQYDMWILRQKREAVESLYDKTKLNQV